MYCIIFINAHVKHTLLRVVEIYSNKQTLVSFIKFFKIIESYWYGINFYLDFKTTEKDLFYEFKLKS